MESSKYVGRVGALAVALGVGAAVTTGTGVAWADTSDTGGADTSQSDTTTETRRSLSSRAEARAERLTRITERVRRGVEDTAERVRQGLEEGASKTRRTLDDQRTSTPRRTRVLPELPESLPEALPDTAPPTSAAETPASRAPKTWRAVRADLDQTPRLRRDTTEELLALPRERTETLSAQVTTAIPSTGSASVSEAPAAVSGSVTALSEPRLVSARSQLTNVVSSLLAVAGLAPLAGGSPAAPSQTPGLWALLAWARREYERSVNPEGRIVSTAAVAPVAAEPFDPSQGLTPKPATPILTPGDTTGMQWVTGGTVTNGNQTNQPSGTPGGYGIAGTDLGIMWDDGNGHVLMLFGDTFDQPNMRGVWRSNVLLRSTDTRLSDGRLTVLDGLYSDGGVYSPITNGWSNRWGATQAIRSPGYTGLFGHTTTLIPTSAIEIDGTQYATVMSVRTWDNPGSWTTNWSAIAVSKDGGKTWTVDPDTIRSSGWLRASKAYVPGNNHFQQNALVTSPDEDDPYVYVYGTPSGRQGSAYLARVEKDKVTDLSAYEYWAGESNGQGQWVRDDPSAAVPVIGKTSTSRPGGFIGWITKVVNDFLGGIIVGGYEGGNVSEMSVQYNQYLGKYVVMYTDRKNNVVMRVSDSPQGTWSDEAIVVANNNAVNPGTGQRNTGMYAPMIHPWSGTGKLTNADGSVDDSNLYFNLSYWGPYNVSLLQTDLSGVKAQYDALAAATVTV